MNLDENIRNKHVYIPGMTQQGKSTLLHYLSLQDIHAGSGVAVLDPKGDLVENILRHIPQNRVHDTIYLDGILPIPVDFMSYETPLEKAHLTGDLISTFNQVSQNASGDRWQSILQWTVTTLLEAKGCSFLDIYYFLVSDSKREKILGRVRNDDIQEYWTEQFPRFPKDSAAPITTRMAKFILNPSLKTMLGTPDAELNIEDVMEGGQVLLVNLQTCGKEAGNLLGTLLVSKFQQAAMRRSRKPQSERKKFYLYADEFQHFQTSAFDDILSEAGGMQFCLTLAHQYTHQLSDEIRHSIFGNVGTYLLFKLGSEDIPFFRQMTAPQDNVIRVDFSPPCLLIEKIRRIRAATGYDLATAKDLAERFRSSNGIYLVDNVWTEKIPPFDSSQLLRLPVGRVLHRRPDGYASFEDTPGPLSPPPDNYAEIIKKRTVDRYARHTERPMLDLKQHGSGPNSTTPDEDDEIKPSGPADVPPHGN